MRVIIAGVLGGIAMFCWSAFSHMVLQVDGGIKRLSNEAAVVSNLQTNITEPGLYFAPGMDMKNATEEQQAAWAKKYEEGPTAFIIYYPTGQTVMGPRQFGLELASNILACLFAALAISWLAGGFLIRVVSAVLFG
ncbi:MAG TPA: hypothetical protein VK468_11995, partial [Pyrinomonadaceae bacterium]|nr:hypothetical protein [Pyrinomonadaceae bacterium]